MNIKGKNSRLGIGGLGPGGREKTVKTRTFFFGSRLTDCANVSGPPDLS